MDASDTFGTVSAVRRELPLATAVRGVQVSMICATHGRRAPDGLLGVDTAGAPATGPCSAAPRKRLPTPARLEVSTARGVARPGWHAFWRLSLPHNWGVREVWSRAAGLFLRFGTGFCRGCPRLHPRRGPASGFATCCSSGVPRGGGPSGVAGSSYTSWTCRGCSRYRATSVRSATVLGRLWRDGSSRCRLVSRA